MNLRSNIQPYNDTDDENSNDASDNEDYNDEEEIQRCKDPDAFLPSGPMSASLMKALGLIPEDTPEVATDWKPPAQSGLAYSKRKHILVFIRPM